MEGEESSAVRWGSLVGQADGVAVVSDTEEGLCGWCVGNYEGRLRELIISVKHRPHVRLQPLLSEVGYGLGQALVAQVQSQLGGWDGESAVEVVALPSGFRRYWKGMLVTPAIAAGACVALEEAGLPAHPTYPLRLRQQWRSQAGRSGAQRWLERDHSMRATAPVSDAVVLVDDVVTTGATMLEAARACREAGAQRIWGLALAQVGVPWET